MSGRSLLGDLMTVYEAVAETMVYDETTEYEDATGYNESTRYVETTTKKTTNMFRSIMPEDHTLGYTAIATVILLILLLGVGIYRQKPWRRLAAATANNIPLEMVPFDGQ